MTVDVVVPVLNEADSIDEFVSRCADLGLAEALIFVDNASTDGTLDRLAAYPHARVIRHATNLGWGASVRDGIAAGSGDCIVIVDADLEYPPEAIPRLLAALQHSPAVYASRFLGPRPPAMPLARRVGNRMMSRFFNLLFAQHVTDFATGMKAVRRAAVPLERLRQNGWEHGAEIAALIALSGHRIDEIAVEYNPRQAGRSKMRHLREAMKVLYFLLRYRLQGRTDV
ncbi:MAG TPA: glycosyltransferase family 2 protein [Candidatus Dormibacteraeota bacterium]|nr:glycosyltransferase family 2 protein [Candidatus Dormibacteraeota bacterium]